MKKKWEKISNAQVQVYFDWLSIQRERLWQQGSVNPRRLALNDKTR
jgi:hypothetical protein